MVYDEAQKERIYKWRAANKEAFNEIQRRAARAYYQKNREKKIEEVKRYKERKKLAKHLGEEKREAPPLLPPLLQVEAI